MSETLDAGIFGGKNVLQNNSSIFEMRARKGRILIPVIIILVALGFSLGSFLLENEDFDYRVAGTEIIEIIKETYGSIEVPNVVWPIAGVYILIILVSIAFKSRWPSYIKIDQTQMIIKNFWEYRFDQPGQNYIIVRPAKISSQIKGRGKSKHLLLEITNADQTLSKFKLYSQSFGAAGLTKLNSWIIQHNQSSSSKNRSF